jgi:ssDNA-binding Zn-finger/Zn-ribbon topoisomerase 1
VYRASRFGRFIACANFPKCRYTEKIKKEAMGEAPQPAEATPVLEEESVV